MLRDCSCLPRHLYRGHHSCLNIRKNPPRGSSRLYLSSDALFEAQPSPFISKNLSQLFRTLLQVICHAVKECRSAIHRVFKPGRVIPKWMRRFRKQHKFDLPAGPAI